MPDITLDALKSDYAALGARITAYEAALPRILNVAAVAIELLAGEHYAGAVLNADGTVKHHLVLMAAKPDDTITWQAAKDWAISAGGVLPDRQEAALIYANCKPHVDGVWHWTSAQHTNESDAWVCDFSYGFQGHVHKGNDDAARAVRRVNP